jgi:hypothetical protein
MEEYWILIYHNTVYCAGSVDSKQADLRATVVLTRQKHRLHRATTAWHGSAMRICHALVPVHYENMNRQICIAVFITNSTLRISTSGCKVIRHKMEAACFRRNCSVHAPNYTAPHPTRPKYWEQGLEMEFQKKVHEKNRQNRDELVPIHTIKAQ